MREETTTSPAMQRYLPRVALEWELDAPDRAWQAIDATLVFVDISGFTRLSEKLARRGRIGAEVLTEVLSAVFGRMLALAYERGGALLKFGGDALLLMFRSDDHAVQACSAAVEMRAALRAASGLPSAAGRLDLKMSVGIHSGTVHLFLVGDLHRELLVAGPAATLTAAMEKAANQGQIMVSPATADALPRGSTGPRVGPGHLLRWRQARVAPIGAVLPRQVPPDSAATSSRPACATRWTGPSSPSTGSPRSGSCASKAPTTCWPAVARTPSPPTSTRPSGSSSAQPTARASRSSRATSTATASRSC